MILVDTSVWIDHFRNSDPQLVGLLQSNQILTHPCVIGEIALGHLRARPMILNMLGKLPQAVVANDDELLGFISQNKLAGVGVGYADAHLLAATRLSAHALLWTRDKQLHRVAARLGLAYDSLAKS
ncbi:MAG: PIN domain-containing protein [Rhodospirillaceae bacterium]|nr:PIN domain-containing protein [Rhodospirillaceae bacterium]